MDPARREALRILVERLEALLDEANLVGLVVDGEVRAVAEPRRLPAEDPATCGMEGQHPHRPDDAAQQSAQPRAHLVGGLVREGDREDLGRLHATRGDQVPDSIRENTRLPRPGAGDDQHRPLRRENRVALRRIQVREVLLGRENGHLAIVTTTLTGSPARLRGACEPSVQAGRTVRRAASTQAVAAASAPGSLDFRTTSTSGPSSRKRG